MLTWIYQAIILLFCGILVWEIVDERRFTRQLTAGLVLVPMLLRLLMIK
jgi:TM2 domain-containing membrane protein YozV